MKQNLVMSLNTMYYTVFSTIHRMYLNTFYCIEIHGIGCN